MENDNLTMEQVKNAANEARQKIAAQANEWTTRLACFDKASERCWGEAKTKAGNGIIVAPSMATVVREADLLWKWMKGGDVPTEELKLTPIISIGGRDPGIRSN